jgi:hypothetical protein
MLLLSAALFSMSAGADCVLPAPPSHLPDGHSANEQEMRAAMRTVQHYNDDVDEYVKCLEFEQRRNLLSVADRTKERTDALDSLAVVVGHFNEQVRIFKSRQS